MKKFVIIGLVLAAALAFGSSCEIQKGGIIRVTNAGSEYAVNVYITKSLHVSLVPPTKDVVAKINIAANDTKDISIGEDGTYYVSAYFYVPVVGNMALDEAAKADPYYCEPFGGQYRTGKG